jgi:hypothetical protein
MLILVIGAKKMNFKSLVKAFGCCALFAVPLSSENVHASQVQVVPGSYTLGNYIALPNGGPSYPYAPISSAGTQSLTSATSQIESTVSLIPFPSLQISGSTTGVGGPVGILELTYQLAVIGPTPNVSVLVGASGSVGGSSTGLGGYFGSLQSTMNVDGSGVSISESVGGQTAGSFALTRVLLFKRTLFTALL